MNIPNDNIAHYPKEDAIVVNDKRILRGGLIFAGSWARMSVDEPGQEATQDMDEILARFAAEVADLREKYEVKGDLLDGESVAEVAYYDELNALLGKTRLAIFDAAMSYIEDDTALNLMLDLFPDLKK